MPRRVALSTYTHALVAGLDEAGRGCLAGPVYAAAVILEEGHGIRGLDDSKALSAAARERLFEDIQQRARAFAIARAEVEEIERLNILHAAMLAMQRAAFALSPAPQLCLVDGNRLPAQLPCAGEAVVQGDAIHAPIMAASILAKVARDHEMKRLDAEYPGYGFAQHKGYGTAVHVAALRRQGPSPVHRMSFAPCAQLALQLHGSRLVSPA
ncbi:RNase HII [Solimonas aquatica]|uniref:Ribonuclease HII n=1 Tax=Solimonas aquatica TaxID=489703 RepID=A0A1H9AJW9_9GAMM|nr:ribonuclease HII [Solimonas aquatica]SEP76683.1 RNase HII [Solimonas aquatica]